VSYDYAAEWRNYIESAPNIRHGTEAHHVLGDISRDGGSFFRFDVETATDYFGAWLTGFGFIEVRFPKATSRDITDDEREWLASHPVVLA